MASEQNTGAKPAPEARAASTPEPTSNPENLKGVAGDVAHTVASDSALTEDTALSLLRRPDLPPEVIEQLAKNGGVVRHRKVKLALVQHPKTPRHVSLSLVRQLYPFDLLQVALTPVVPAVLKLAADEALCSRLETVSPGEKVALAHRGSGRVAGELLLDADPGVVQAAIENSRLTESSIVRALMKPEASAVFVEAVSHHPQWSLRREVRLALLRNEKTPMARAVEFARALPAGQVREILESSRLSANLKAFLRADVEKRAAPARKRNQ